MKYLLCFNLSFFFLVSLCGFSFYFFEFLFCAKKKPTKKKIKNPRFPSNINKNNKKEINQDKMMGPFRKFEAIASRLQTRHADRRDRHSEMNLIRSDYEEHSQQNKEHSDSSG